MTMVAAIRYRRTGARLVGRAAWRGALLTAVALAGDAAAACGGRGCPDEAVVTRARAVAAAACDCGGTAGHARYVRCAKRVLAAAVRDGTLPRACRKPALRCEADSTCGMRDTAICCARRNGRVKARAIRAGGVCAGTVCAGGRALADACTPEGACRGRRGAGRAFRGVQQVFQASCALPSCHSSLARKGGLALDGETVSYSNLVDRPATHPEAQQLDLLRVRPGDPEGSLLVRKLRGRGPGDAMPQAAGLLPDPVVHLVEDWIARGARPTEEECPDRTPAGIRPQHAADEQSLCDDEPLPTGPYVWQPETPLPVPAPSAGVQLYAPPRDVPPGTEWETCHVFRPDWAAVSAAIGGGLPVVRRQTYRMHKGSHHLLLYMYVGQHPEAWPQGPFPCEGLHGLEAANAPPDAAQSTFLVGGTSFQNYVVEYPQGVGLPMLPNAVLIMNLHVTNPFQPAQPMYGEAWVNIDLYAPGEFKALIDGVLGPNENDLVVEAYETRTITRIWTPFSVLGWPASEGVPVDAAVFQLYGHYHHRGNLFRIDFVKDGRCSASGALCGRDDDCACRPWQRACVPGQHCARGPEAEDTTIYYSTAEWDSLPVVDFPPPYLRVLRDQGLRVTCRFTNGVLGDPSRPPKRCHQGCESCGWDAATRTCVFTRGVALGVDATPRVFAEGEPMPLVFGELTDDEMCTMAGYYIRLEDLPRLGL